MKNLLFVSCLILAATPVCAQAAPGRSSVLGTEPALQKQVLVRARRLPMADLIAQLSRDTGVPLAASEDTADEPVHLFARGRPAREILALVAEHFDYSWIAKTRNGKRTLVLIQDLAAKRREQALRGSPERDVADLRRWLEGRVQAFLSPEIQALRKQPLEARLARIAALDEELHGPWVADGQGKRRQAPPLPRETRERLEKEMQALHLASPEAVEFNFDTTAHLTYAALPDELREALWRGEPVEAAYPPEKGRFSLSPQQARELVAGGLGHLASREDPTTLREAPVPFHSFERVRVRLALDDTGASTRLSVRLRTVGSHGDPGDPCRVEHLYKEQVLPEYVRDLPPAPSDPLDAAARALHEPVTLEARLSPPVEGERRVPEAWFDEALEQLSQQVSYPILADGYLTAPHTGAFGPPKAAFARVLERLCRSSGRTCRLDKGWLLFRHGQWARARAHEPPARAVRRWEESIRRYGYLRFADTVEIVGGLSEEQARLFEASLQWKKRHGIAGALRADLEQSRPALRLLRALPASLRSALERGREISLRQLPPSALRHAASVFLEAADHLVGDEDLEELQDPDERFVIGAGFAREDELEARWLATRLRLGRRPQRWMLTPFGPEPIQSEEERRRLEKHWER